MVYVMLHGIYAAPQGFSRVRGKIILANEGDEFDESPFKRSESIMYSGTLSARVLKGIIRTPFYLYKVLNFLYNGSGFSPYLNIIVNKVIKTLKRICLPIV